MRELHRKRQAKDVVKGLKKRLGSKNAKVQILSLMLLEMLMKNCGDVVHMHVAERDVLHQMVKIVRKRPVGHVREKILSLIDTWQEAFGGPRARYPQYYAAYQELLSAGAVFPQRSEGAAPIFTPPQTQPLSSYTQSLTGPDYQRAIGSEFPTLSLTEIQNARGIMDVLAEMLNALEPGNKEALKQEVIVDLVEQCRSYKQRVVQLVNTTTSDEELLCQGLSLNDDLDRLLSKHDVISSGTSVHPETQKTTSAFLGIGDGSGVSNTSSAKMDKGSSSSSSANQPPMQQLLLPAPPAAATAPSPVIDPKMDLLSGDDYQSPSSNDIRALVPVGEPSALASRPQPQLSQDLIVLSEPFAQDSPTTTSLDSQMNVPTSQTSQVQNLSQTPPQQQQSQPIFYPNESLSYVVGPQQQQMQHTLYSNGVVPLATQSLQQIEPTVYSNGAFPTMGAPQQMQAQMQRAVYPNGGLPNIGAPQYDQAVYLQRVNVNQIHPAWSTQFANLSPHQQNAFYGAPQRLPPAPWDVQPIQTQSMAFASIQQPGVQFPDQRTAYYFATAQDLSQRARGLSLQDNRYVSPYQTSESYLQPKNQAKPEDKLFGDLVNIAKTKSKPSASVS
ncbi:TOM1-like protein 9 isoform X2 [Nymphaea colorata]|uniref:TOM1-like protein 9 isoform X2 n=1 Tax=Nymphaea colorata TaxID=210225 RepID=UPI00214E0077|nr:TOM1-like protein 9 isoform X2 [Nymphaea colorata]